MVEKASRFREGEATQKLNKAEQCPPFLSQTFVNMRKLEMPRIMRRTLEGGGRMPSTFSLTGEFSSCVAVYLNGLKMPRVARAQGKQCSELNWQWELNPSASKWAAV